jgi:hypothetical protein
LRTHLASNAKKEKPFEGYSEKIAGGCERHEVNGGKMKIKIKRVKSLLLGSAAGLIVISAGQAADLPVKAKPVASTAQAFITCRAPTSA